MPRPADAEAAQTGLERLVDAARRSEDPALIARAEALIADADATGPAARAVRGLFGSSPFLTQCAVIDPRFFLDLLARGPDAGLALVNADLDRARADWPAEDEVGRVLRVAKRRVALLTGLADVLDVWDLDRVTGTLSAFAERAIGLAAGHLLRALDAKGAIALPDRDDPETGSGLIILGMGKLGARELNYSSDIDLIVLYDDEVIRTDNPDGLQSHFVRLTRNLVRLLDERTRHGYVFRTDLRLRPDPGSTPPALSALAAETYYESIGQNWERAAMIKARPVAGDRAAGRQFLDRLRPYVWRKNLDFAAIQDVHSIKRQINAHRGGGTIAVNGHNVKLGRGGIREIEFFAQTQQLIWGGRLPELRLRETVPAIRALCATGKVRPEVADDMIDAYRFLRRVEHRLQMINDEQTHSLPEADAGLAHLALFLGYDSAAAFTGDLLANLRRVEAHYAALFEDSPSLGGRGGVAGNLVFTGGESDPDTLDTLSRLGFDNPKAVDATVRGWHHGRYRATRSSRTRQILTELMPALLEALSRTPNPGPAFLKFDEFLSRLPTGLQLFSMFHANPQLLDLVAEIMGGAPKLADHLSRHPSILESVLAGDFMDTPPEPEDLDEELDRLLTQAEGLEDMLDISRRWANDRRFQVGVQNLRGLIDPRDAARALSNVAETAVSRLLPRVVDDFSIKHGRILNSAIGVLALGKLGAMEMTPASDLDMVFIYDAPPGVETSTGGKPLVVSQYFARLSQRLINAITAQTAEGVLYEVDMRLRPSGNAGPIATSYDAFVQYHAEAAWTWERMALTRARMVAGPQHLAARINGAIREILTRRDDPDHLLRDVAEMRLRIDRERHTEVVWEIKYYRGGLVDVEFIAQYLQLRHGPAHPDVLSPNTRDGLLAVRQRGLVDGAVIDDLVAALDLWQALQGILRLSVDGGPTEDEDRMLPAGLRQALVTRAGAVDFADLKTKIRDTAQGVMAHYRTLIEDPARAAGANLGDSPRGDPT
ncbi:MAG: bifunctional [glutamine synthetase] adenylyltransferase/[glutamine synthetase]-adenylyl-L-tyrosine phosphorylase [Rhodobacterales bacterium]|nr:bifunctional [glutamine synthetase] adenylyltransferase/[glutamine synthetase]-adenylyl-L-tyrosine phosphorylase [Rhodobacterales bacterium]